MLPIKFYYKIGICIHNLSSYGNSIHLKLLHTRMDFLTDLRSANNSQPEAHFDSYLT